MRPRTLVAIGLAGVSLTIAPAATAAPPANDYFEQATSLTVGAILEGKVDEATHQPGEPAAGGPTVWYVFRPAVDQRVAALTYDYGFLRVLQIYSGTGLSDLHQIAGEGIGGDRVAFSALAGRTYWMSVNSQQARNVDTAFKLRLDAAPRPAHDAFADATPIHVPGRYTGSLIDATHELGESDRGLYELAGSVWFRFRARRTGRLTIDATTRDCGTALAVYTGRTLASLRAVNAVPALPVRIRAHRGKTYHMVLDCQYLQSMASPRTGEYTLTVSDGSIEGKGVTASVDPGQAVRDVRRRGLRFQVGTRRAATVGVALIVGRQTADRLKLRNRVLGRTSGRLRPKQTLPATIRLTPAARRALRNEQTLSAVLRLTLLKTSAPNRVLNVAVRLPTDQ